MLTELRSILYFPHSQVVVFIVLKTQYHKIAKYSVDDRLHTAQNSMCTSQNVRRHHRDLLILV